MQLYNEFEPRPVVSFGFGGKLIVMFPKKPTKLNVLDTTTVSRKRIFVYYFRIYHILLEM